MGILVTGASGLVGSDLCPALQKKHGQGNVIASDLKLPEISGCVAELADVTDLKRLGELVGKHGVSEIYHLAGLMSAGGEKNPNLAWKVNLEGLKNVLDIAVKHKAKVFWPSSIAVFGPTTPRDSTPQHTILEPTTIYGITKLTGELLCQYYNLKYGLDVRSLRYPGLIGHKGEPGDGTTEYAISIFYGAIKDRSYTCFLKEDTVLPMMYMDDAIKGTLDIMEAEPDSIRVRTSYNFSALSFSPKDICDEIRKHIPDFKVAYDPDYRQQIAESWPKAIDDSDARKDWNWKPNYDLPSMTRDMLKHIGEKLGAQA